jgi:predicted PurR-regulated permease PerM
MLTAAIALICLGLLGLAFGVLPDYALAAVSAIAPNAPTELLRSMPQALVAVSGAIYLSGVVLLAGALLRRTAVAYLQTLIRQRADLESLQGAVLVALERLEADQREAIRRQQFVSSEIRTLAEEFERANSAQREPERSAAALETRS